MGCFLADRLRRGGEFDKAAAIYRQLLLRPPATAAREGLISLERKRRNADALLAAIGEAIDGKLGIAEAWEADEAETKAVSADAALVREIAAAARKRLAAAPDKLDYGQRLTVALLAMDAKQNDLAGEFFELAIKARPRRAAALLAVWGLGLLDEGRARRRRKRFSGESTRRRLRKTAPHSTSTFPRRWRRRGGADEALAAARKAAALGKDLPRLCVRPAWVLREAKRYDEAIAAFAAVLAKFDADTDAQTRKLRGEARAALAKGDLKPVADLGLAEHIQDERFAPEMRDVLHEVRLALADLCIVQNRIAEGEEWAEQVLDEYPEDAAALNELGYLWADQGVHLDRALEMIRKAVAAEPDNAAYRDSLGWVLYRLGRGEEAVAELQKAAAGKDPDGEILDHLGDAWRRSAAGTRPRTPGGARPRPSARRRKRKKPQRPKRKSARRRGRQPRRATARLTSARSRWSLIFAEKTNGRWR